MSSVEHLREFVNERLTAAAEEIFGVLKNTIFEYEEEINRQRRLLDVVWKPEIKLHRIKELPQQHVCKKEEEEGQIQERSSSLDQEEPEPPQIKQEQEGLCTSQEGEQLTLKQETAAFMLTPTHEERGHGEDQTLNLAPDDALGAAEEESVANMPVIASVVSEAHSDPQLRSHNSHEAEKIPNRKITTQKGGKKRRRDAINVNGPNLLKIHRITDTGKKSVNCDTCGKGFKYNSLLQRHMMIHTGEKPYSCQTCGKDFRHHSHLLAHMRTHTGEKLYSCKTCGRAFVCSGVLKSHTRIHTGEKPYPCKTCGKDFRSNGDLTVHMRIHTGEKPFTCKTCGKRFITMSDTNRHMRIHHLNKHKEPAIKTVSSPQQSASPTRPRTPTVIEP
ncbi:zinc finger protein 841-like isoform X2 [Sander lucioperca]|uniref:zinc finger protein 841-like isoform X2 n=1 Tax=Sander lucioperca TaxID=283035 RepID=UPI001653D007|nr:zinc finger protein 841-like isoform X2 [Sander lucioperca]